MPNNFSAFFEVLVAGAGEYNKAKVGRTALLDAVYKDVKPEVARVGKTVDVYFPDVGPMTAINNNQLVGATVNPNYIPLVFQNRVGKALQFQDFEQWQTATDLAEKFFDPLYKRAKEYLNGQIAALITQANFNCNAPIIGPTQGEILVTDQLNAWGVLADQKVPLEDADKLRLMCHNRVYQKMLGDDEWVRENVVSALIATEARTKASIANAFNFTPVWDQQMPTASGSIIYGQVALTNGSTAVTGLNTAFTTDLTTSSFLVFGNDPTKTPYSIASITSDTALVLGAAYSGASATTTARRITQLSGTVAIATTGAVTGTGTNFTGQLAVGQWITVAGDPNTATAATGYQIAAITSGTAATVVTPPLAAVPAGAATVNSYTNLALHEYAIALALRPIATPPEAQNVVDVTYIDLQGIPLRVMVSYVHIYQALFVTVDFGYALGVIRPDFGVIIQC
jgi:hypothetical protein